MKWTDKEIVEWHKKTFPKITKEEQISKVYEEVKELVMAIMNKEGEDRIREEYIDVYIASLVLDKRFNGLEKAIEDKMDKNVKRKWFNNHHI